MSYSDLPYRPCVGIVLFNREGKVFVGERIDTPGAWQMPQGGIDKGETVEESAFRELKEEVGTDQADIARICEKKMYYDLPRHLLGRLWNGKYRGQVQTWVALTFTGSDEDIVLDYHHDPEFRDWCWIEFRDVLDFAVPFKRNTYESVLEEFNDLIEFHRTNIIG